MGDLASRIQAVEDGLCSLTSCRLEGATLGGGISFVRTCSIDSFIGQRISRITRLYSSLMCGVTYVLRIISVNAGFLCDFLIDELGGNDFESIGFDASRGELVDGFNRGIIDATRSLRYALARASQTSSSFLTVDYTINDGRVLTSFRD